MMRRVVLGLLGLALLAPVQASAAAYDTQARGAIVGFRLSGVEPDGDPLYQVALKMRLSASGGLPAATLIVSAYLENFSPDTTPVLPDLIHPKHPAHNLGGFLDGKMLLVDDAGDTLVPGIFLNEAFLDNSNHTHMTFYRNTSSTSIVGDLKGTFTLNKSGGLRGIFVGTLSLPSTVLAQLRRHQGSTMRPLKQIIDRMTVHPHYYGTRGTHASHPYKTGYGPVGGSPASRNAGRQAGGRTVSPLTIAAATGAAISLLLAGVLYWIERRRTRAKGAVGRAGE